MQKFAKPWSVEEYVTEILPPRCTHHARKMSGDTIQMMEVLAAGSLMICYQTIFPVALASDLIRAPAAGCRYGQVPARQPRPR